MQYVRMPIEVESPEEMGYGNIKINLTESSYSDQLINLELLELKEVLLCYGNHRGHSLLRELIAAEGKNIHADNVLLTVGASAALFMVATTLLDAGSEIIVVRPNYATNIETPKAIGAAIHYIDLKFEEGFKINISEVEKVISPTTKYISVTHPHNPTGVCLTADELRQLAMLAEKNNCYLLVDETYRDLVHGELLPLATDFSEKVISVSSCSKSFGLPGIRLGWIVARDKALLEKLLAAKEQIHITGSVLDEEVAYRFLLKKEEVFGSIKRDIAAKFEILCNWYASQQEFEWVQPAGGVVCFPRIRHHEHVDIDKFYHILNKEYGTFVGPGHWFEMPKHYMRIGYAWLTPAELKEGLHALTASVQKAWKV